MGNNCFKIQMMRTLLYDKNILYIKGFYMEDSEEAKIRVFADGKELLCDERKTPCYEEDREIIYQNKYNGIETIILVQIPEISTFKNIEIVYEDQVKTRTLLKLSEKRLERIQEECDYNIDALEKIGDYFVMKGWFMYSQTYSLHLFDDKNQEIETNVNYYDRADVEMVYPEVENYKKILGFKCKFKCNDAHNIFLVMGIDEQQEMISLDTRSDFLGNKRLSAVLRKTIKTKGLYGAIVMVIRQLRHPVLLVKRILNHMGIMIRISHFLKKFKKEIKRVYERHLLKTQYSEFDNKYPNAMKRLICLADMGQIKQEKEMHHMGDVKFSVLVPLYNTPVDFLNEMIESVQMQTYENWELCLADGSDEKHSYVGEICKNYQEHDHRILYKKLEKNYGISGNTNECIKMATGNYIALFDHDDFLHPMVFQKCYEVILSDSADYVYTDEATFQVDLDNVGTYHFKPDYAPDNLRANNYICHFSTFSKALLDKVGWYDSTYDGSQDHDLILRLTEQAGCVKHIPEILYFWRSHPGSVAEDINSKVYAIEAGKKAVLASLKRNGMSGSVDSSKAFPTIYRIKYDILEKPLISIIIINRNSEVELQKCVESIRSKSTYEKYEIIVVKNNDSNCDKLEELHNVKVINWDDEYHEAAMNNFAVKHANGRYVLFLSDEIKIISPEWIEEMLMYAQRNDVGAVGAKLYYPNNTIRHAGMVLGMGKNKLAAYSHYRCHRNELGYMGRLYYSQNVSAVSAECMMMNKEVFEQMGGFDAEFKQKYYDVDLCVKAIEKGYLNVFTPYSEVYYCSSLSKQKTNCDEDVVKFKEKWKENLQKGDSYFNTNFSLDHSYFEMKNINLFR